MENGQRAAGGTAAVAFTETSNKFTIVKLEDLFYTSGGPKGAANHIFVTQKLSNHVGVQPWTRAAVAAKAMRGLVKLVYKSLP